MRKKKAALLLATVLLAGTLQGCWNYRELDSMMIVAGCAIDSGYQGYKYHMTIDIADTSNAGKDKPVVSTLVESEGDTIFEAENNAIKRVGMELYWQNCQVVVIGQDVARESIVPVVDWLNRDIEPRLTIELFISEEKTAKELLQQQSATMAITSFEIDKYYELNEKVQPIAQYTELYEIYNTLADNGTSLLLPALKLEENMGDKVCMLDGMAVFDRDRLMGFLTAEDSKFVMFVTNHVKGGFINVKASTENTIGALKIYSSNARVKPAVENGKASVAIEITTEVSLDELDTLMEYTSKDRITEFEYMAESQLAAQIGNTIQLVQQQFGRDIYGFGDILHRSDPAAWSQISANWDEAFSTAKIQVSCKVEIRNREENVSPVHVAR